MNSAQEWLKTSIGVSRETLSRLETYVALVELWTKKINLISPKSVPDIWTRHILDSAQLFPIAPETARTWADMGSGGGFPGLVIAILWQDKPAACEFHLIESDQRKAVFLRTAIRELGVHATVHAKRIEDVPDLGADVVSARALAPLKTLLSQAKHHGHAETVGLFPKGQAAQADIEDARRNWSFTCRQHQSITDPAAQILEVGAIRERHDAT